MIIHNIWQRHNYFIYDNVFTCPKQVVALTINQRDAFQDATGRESRRGTTAHDVWPRAKKKWVKPQGPEVKTN